MLKLGPPLLLALLVGSGLVLTCCPSKSAVSLYCWLDDIALCCVPFAQLITFGLPRLVADVARAVLLLVFFCEDPETAAASLCRMKTLLVPLKVLLPYEPADALVPPKWTIRTLS